MNMEFLLVIIPLILLIGSILGFVSLSKIKNLELRVYQLEKKIKGEPQTTQTTKPTPGKSASDQSETVEPKPVTDQPDRQSDWNTGSLAAEATNNTQQESEPVTAKPSIDWVALLQQYWMVALGGICLVFSGVFLVRYSIESGMLGPTARITLGLLFGAGLIAAGEKLRRSGHLDAGVHAALAAAGSLVIYSALFVGFQLYGLFTAQIAFASMALMSALSMLLALKHGPLMAAMGLLGAYLVPILVSDGSGNIEAALLYSFIVTCGSFWLQKHIYRTWLWWGTWLGALGWFVLSLNSPDTAQGLRAAYLAGLAYVGTALAFAGFKLNKIDVANVCRAIYAERNVQQQLTGVFIALSIAMVLALHVESLNVLSYPAVALLPMVAALLARHNLPQYRLLPLITLLPILVELFAMDIRFLDWKISIEPLAAELQNAYIMMLVSVVAVFAVIGSREFFNRRNPGYWAAFILFMPLVAIILAYLRISSMDNGIAWALSMFIIGGSYAFLLVEWRKRQGNKIPEVEAALAIASQAAIAVACFFAFSAFTLTLVLAVQLVGLAYIDQKIKVSVLPLIMKVLLLVVIVRLTFNPWIILYEVSSFTILLTYIACLAACVVAAREVRGRAELVVWLHSASAHLLVLTVAVFTRYLLYGGDVFAQKFTLTEASVYLCSWAAIGIIYHWKSKNLQHYKKWYRGLALLHIYAAAALYVFYNMLFHNPLWSAENISNTPVFNVLLIGYGLPVILAAIIYRQISGLRKAAGLIAVAGLYLFVSLEIRHLWNAGLHLNMPVNEGELYTYSLVWLILAVVIMIYGAYKHNADAKKAGVAALLIVVAKVFFWDMRDLDGLWRVISFLGLGASLLGIAFLVNKFKPPLEVSETSRN